MTVTLQQVAALAGVSRSTASRALSGSPAISGETRRIVEQAAGSLGYRPNRMASGLRSRRSGLIGLVLNNLINNSFHTIAEVVHRRAAAGSYQVLLCITDADPERERSVLQTLADHRVDGVIIAGTGQNARVTNALREQGTAVVNLIRAPRESSAPAVLAADREGAADAVSYLLGLGHTRIGYIGGPAGTNSGDERWAGYAGSLAAAGLAVDDGLVRRGPFAPEFGVAAVDELFGSGSAMTALFVANHEAVFGALPALSARRIRVPEDLSLVCHEDIPWLRWWNPPVTVVDNGARELGELSMDVLLQQLARRDGSRPAAGNGAPTAGGGSRATGSSGPAGTVAGPARAGGTDVAVTLRPGRTYRVGAQLVLRGSCRPFAGRPAGPPEQQDAAGADLGTAASGTMAG
ncbi:LacI family DNA-binding transcriptional regulator [Nakamurella endophytica]|uniref:LacI family transcriptional regulator n=1 Tax=Nakamurella endophytica TaxID=1748367 RepID=A0A917TAE6_9ACTN|nr:LacI family DNA-binding transcriptional regulator [Nakamurella endophytica]GGM15538.1 LacI family transcriptional regulator [Nakamurella endophytica]